MLLSVDRKLLLRFCGWFTFVNVIIFWVVCFKYFSAMPWIHTIYLTPHGQKTVTVLALVSYLSQLALLSGLIGLFLVVCAMLFSSRKILFSVAVIVFSVATFSLIIDSLIYSLYRFHLSGPIFDLILQAFSTHVFDLSWYECLLASVMVCVIIIVEFLAAYLIWTQLVIKKRLSGVGKWLAIFLMLGIYFSYSLVFYTGNLWVNRMLVDVDRTLPLFAEIVSLLLPTKQSKLALERFTEHYLVQPEQAHAPLHYPLQPLSFHTGARKLNLLVIAIDTWRFDMLNQQVTPTLTTFSKKSWYFSNHLSGGDSTGPGIFSLFYALPVTYWTSMEQAQQGPILIRELLNQHYQMGVFSSGDISKPAFNRTVFVDVKNRHSEQQVMNLPELRDQAVTNDFKKFLAARNSTQPFFSFLFYDAAHSYCEVKNMRGPFQPVIPECNRLALTNQTDPTPYFNRYKNALNLVDQQIAVVLNLLQKEKLLDNTIVVITGDHGEEFNDNHLGFWGHASNFTHYQVQTPLIVYWPGEKPATFTHRTTHYDIAPTLMNRLLGCDSNTADYSLGRDLLDRPERSYFIIGSYIDFGVVQRDRITTIFPAGNVEVDQLNGQLKANAKLDIALMQQVFSDMRRFYRKNMQ